MTKRIVLIHAVPVAMPPVVDAFRRLWPTADRVNILDDSLSTDRAKVDHLSPALFVRFEALSSYAQLVGADGVLFTCSAFGPAIEAVAQAAPFPILKPNEAMFEAALGCGSRIGMVATFAPAVASMESEFNNLARRRRSSATIKTVCVPDALVALNKGDVRTHDALVAAAAGDLAHCDVIMLAQFSMSGARSDVAARTDVPVLTSPDSAALKLKALLEG
jgi:Asp/Glu/hydantoin racemase